MNELIVPNNAIAETKSFALSVQELKQRKTLIHEVMGEVMVEGEHYGTIPGCGTKKALYKSGGELLMLTFRLSNETTITQRDLPNGHREYEAKVSICDIGSGAVIATGFGMCTTMESKYRYRQGAVEFTGRQVPKEYWNIRNSNPVEAQQLLGGKGFAVKKNEFGQYEIVQRGEVVENDNPADQYNTVLKMADKRAFLAAIIKALAVTDIFAPEGDGDDDDGNKTQKPQQPQQNKYPSKKQPPQPATEKQVNEIKYLIQSPLLMQEEKEFVNDDYKKGLTIEKADAAIKWMKDLIAERESLPK